jgi:hypothetical protein
MMFRLRHHVIVIPGIGGSVLERHRKAVWGSGLLNIANAALRPEPLVLDEGDGIEPAGLLPDATVGPFWAAIRGYDELRGKLTDAVGPKDYGTWVHEFG